MHNINPTFTDEEIAEMKQIKEQARLTWHDLILDAIRAHGED